MAESVAIPSTHFVCISNNIYITLRTMDYEKKYEKLVDAVKVLRDNNPSDEGIQNWVSDNVPELGESEDARTRKGLTDFLKRKFENSCSPTPSKKVLTGWIAWLEKQGEKELDPRYSILDKLIEADDIYQMSVNDTMVGEAKNKAIEALSNLEISKLLGLEKQGEQKSIWHNEDEEPQRGSLILLIMQSGTPIVAKIIEPNHTFNHGERWAYIDDLLEKQGESKFKQHIQEGDKIVTNEDGTHFNVSQLERVAKKENLAWSEEDIFKVQRICMYLEEAKKYYADITEVRECIDYIKSLKDRFQPQWKPSDEQLDALHDAAVYVDKSMFPYPKGILMKLYKQLKKL